MAGFPLFLLRYFAGIIAKSLPFRCGRPTMLRCLAVVLFTVLGWFCGAGAGLLLGLISIQISDQSGEGQVLGLISVGVLIGCAIGTAGGLVIGLRMIRGKDQLPLVAIARVPNPDMFPVAFQPIRELLARHGLHWHSKGNLTHTLYVNTSDGDRAQRLLIGCRPDIELIELPRHGP
jgi:hypothetical protein